jgi:lipid-binding SYLF domain-containing protein
MKLMKTILALMLVSVLAFSCKSDKKNTTEEVTDAVEAAAEEAGDAVEEAADDVEEVAEEVSDSAEEVAEAVTETPLTVVYPKDTKLQNQVEGDLAEFAKSNPDVSSHLHRAYGFAFFPKVTKAGLGVGGAGGKGLVFENNTVIGESHLAQATFGLQAGGQQYMEIILFEDKPALDRFTSGKIKFSGQASAVALNDGASVDVNYQDGVAVFTKTMGGLMAEASVGGQKFTYHPGIN